jgi:hypothetical protein
MLRMPKNWLRMNLFSLCIIHVPFNIKLNDEYLVNQQIKPVPESYDCQFSNASLNIKNAQKLIENEPILL